MQDHEFDYDLAFSRNIGWVTPEEQRSLKNKRVAVGGLGGVGGSHLIALARLGVGGFTISDLDDFEIHNFNRQYGATVSSIGQPKVDVMEKVLRDINPEADVRCFKSGIALETVDEFLADADIYVDSLDIYALPVRRKIFQRCYEKGIPAVTAAPVGMGTSMLIFLPGKMSFEEYFCLEGHSFEEQIFCFIIGVAPSMMMMKYLQVEDTVNLFKRKVPSTVFGIELSAGVACTNVLKLLLNRGEIIAAPRGLHFDAYLNRLSKTWRPWGNKNPIQRFMFRQMKRMFCPS